MTLPEFCAAVRARLEAATPGPWRVHDDDGIYSDSKVVVSESIPYETTSVFDVADALLIANAPTDLDRLLRICEVQREALESVKRNYLLEHLNATSVDACGDKVYEAIALGDAIAREGEGNGG